MPDIRRNQRVTIMGLGRFGGGAGAARWLSAQGASILITDLSSEDRLGDSLAELSDLTSSGDIKLRLGGHFEEDFTSCDLVVANPAVPHPWTNKYLLAARNAGVPLTTEIRLVAEQIHRERVIGVTGTAGKSTTSSMIHHLLTRAGCRSHLGGNIGGSILGDLDQIEPDAWIVLELSSAMLYWLSEGVGSDSARGWSPHVSMMTNLRPNHLDWHGTMEHYEQSKRRIFTYQQAGDHRITEDDLPAVNAMSLAIPGAHNQTNARFALAAVQAAIGISPDEAAPLLADFKGLPHRLQLVAERGGQRFYNDSKSTTPRATVLAVRAFDDPARVHLIAGGYDKKIDLSDIAELSTEVAGLYTIGATGGAIADAAPNAATTFSCETLAVAVKRAMERMGDDAILLLSPGCASWDQFDNFESRGAAFAEAVEGGG